MQLFTNLFKVLSGRETECQIEDASEALVNTIIVIHIFLALYKKN